MLHSKVRLTLEIPFRQWLFEATRPDTIRIAPLSPEAVIELDRLPKRFHGDPADRIIVATAQANNFKLHTHDRRMRRSKIVPLWKP